MLSKHASGQYEILRALICFKEKWLVIYEFLQVDWFTPVDSRAITKYGNRGYENEEIWSSLDRSPALEIFKTIILLQQATKGILV